MSLSGPATDGIQVRRPHPAQAHQGGVGRQQGHNLPEGVWQAYERPLRDLHADLGKVEDDDVGEVVVVAGDADAHRRVEGFSACARSSGSSNG